MRHQKTYRQFLFLFIAGPVLRLQDKFPARPQLCEHPFEGHFQAGIAPVEMEPFGHRKAQDQVILGRFRQQEALIFQDVVCLELEKYIINLTIMDVSLDGSATQICLSIHSLLIHNHLSQILFCYSDSLSCHIFFGSPDFFDQSLSRHTFSLNSSLRSFALHFQMITFLILFITLTSALHTFPTSTYVIQLYMVYHIYTSGISFLQHSLKFNFNISIISTVNIHKLSEILFHTLLGLTKYYYIV